MDNVTQGRFWEEEDGPRRTRKPPLRSVRRRTCRRTGEKDAPDDPDAIKLQELQTEIRRLAGEWLSEYLEQFSHEELHLLHQALHLQICTGKDLQDIFNDLVQNSPDQYGSRRLQVPRSVQNRSKDFAEYIRRISATWRQQIAKLPET